MGLDIVRDPGCKLLPLPVTLLVFYVPCHLKTDAATGVTKCYCCLTRTTSGVDTPASGVLSYNIVFSFRGLTSPFA